MSKENKTEEMEDEILKNEGQKDIDQETATQETASEEELKEEEVKEEISLEEKLQEDLDKEKDKFLRLFAEFENYKRRTSKERMELFKTAGQEVILSLLPVLDDFDRAMAEISKSGDEAMFKGVELINNKLVETLKSKGLL
ncbi:MAG: nucleotide exchange factor GrpE, partial [Arenibacter sp.]|nr:nucleotide exchange factor GrpE [Arenibacter sp.]